MHNFQSFSNFLYFLLIISAKVVLNLITIFSIMLRITTLIILTYLSLNYLGFSTLISLGLPVGSAFLALINPFIGLVTYLCSITYSAAVLKLLAPELFYKIINLIEKLP